SISPQTIPALSSLTFAGETEVQISGFDLFYDLDAAVGVEPKQIKDWQSDFPGVRSIYLESHMRYLFTRYGVLYAVSLECFDGVARPKRLSCREADAIATQFLKALTVAGGMPQAPAKPSPPKAVERPQNLSTAFAYHSPGQLISGTGVRNRGGHIDYTVYAGIRFPLA